MAWCLAMSDKERIAKKAETIRKLMEERDQLKEEIEQLKERVPKKGHWEMKIDPFGLFVEIPVCSVCGCTNDMRKKTVFCEHCGADMRYGDEQL